MSEPLDRLKELIEKGTVAEFRQFAEANRGLLDAEHKEFTVTMAGGYEWIVSAASIVVGEHRSYFAFVHARDGQQTRWQWVSWCWAAISRTNSEQTG